MQYSEYIEQTLIVAQTAAREVHEIYEAYRQSGEIDSQQKGDNSPLTRADTVAHEIISKQLGEWFPNIPLISEENKEYTDLSETDLFWLVDPLDGTKEFLKQNGEFTVNIGLIDGKYPVGGVIIAPAISAIYWADGNGAYYKEEGDEKEKVTVSKRDEELVAVQSQSHSSNEEEEFLQQYNISDSQGAGSSLKFCRVAEGKADIYYRGGQTMEWDTAAGQAIVEAAGGTVQTADGERLSYRKDEYKNSPFVASNGRI